MKIKLAASALILSVSLTGCGVQDLAKQAADATACKALDSTIKAIAASYEAGVIDTGLITKIDSLVGDQARSLLSTGLAADIKALTNALNETNSANSSKENVKSLTDSISQRCSDAGVPQIGN
jgi:hypothetical protein